MDVTDADVRGVDVFVCAGMRRAASTLQYNAVVSAGLEAGNDVWRGELKHFTPETPLDGCEWVVVKVHEFRKRLANRADWICTSRRDLDEAYDSYNELVGGTNKGRENCRRVWLEDFRQWKRRADHVLDYDRLLAVGSKTIVHELVETLPVSPSLPAVYNRTRHRCQPPADERDRDTLVSPNHYTQDNPYD